MSGGAATTPLALPTRLSPSALTRYRTCPKQFLLADIERRARSGERSPVLAQGNAIHEALQLFFGLPLEYRSADNAERCLRAVWRNHRDGAFASVAEEAESGRTSIALLRGFCASFDITVEPVARERWVGLRVGGTRLYGKVDRIDRYEDGLALVDYKTGKHALDATDLRHEAAVQVYVLGAEADLHLPVKRVRLIYLALDTEVVWELEREDVEMLAGKLRTTLAEIEAETSFEARPGTHCRFCPAQLDCPDKDRVEIEDVAQAAEAAAEEMPF